MAINDYIKKQTKKVTQKVGSLFNTPASVNRNTRESMNAVQQTKADFIRKGIVREENRGYEQKTTANQGKYVAGSYTPASQNAPSQESTQFRGAITNKHGEFLRPGTDAYDAEILRQQGAVKNEDGGFDMLGSSTTKTGGIFDDQLQEAASLARVENQHDTELLGFAAEDMFPEEDLTQKLANMSLAEKLDYYQSKEKSRLQTQIDEANRTDQRSKDISDRSTKSQMAGTTAAFAQDREGAMSMTTPMLGEKTNAIFQESMDESQRRMDFAMNQRADAMAKLEEAHANNNVEAAKAYQDQIVYQNFQIEKQKQEAENIALASSEENRRAQASMVQNTVAFAGLVNQGTQLTTEGIKGMASNFGINFETALDYYEGAQAIRDDKTLNLEQKELQHEANLFKMQEIQQGIFSDDIRKVNYINELRASGASQKTISEALDVMGMTNVDDEGYILDLRIKASEAQMKEDQANGVLTNPLDQAKYNQMIAEQAVANGGTGTYVNNHNSKYSTAVNQDGSITVGVDETTNLGNRGQCGAFVNDYLGTQLGDTLDSKLAYTDPSIKVPSAGMLFVMGGGYDLGSGQGVSGHTGIVEGINADGTVNIVEANMNNDRKITRRTLPLSSFLAFGVPPNGTHVGGEGIVATGQIDDLESMRVDSLASKLGSDKDARAQIAENLRQVIRDGRASTAKEAAKLLNLGMISNEEADKMNKEVSNTDEYKSLFMTNDVQQKIDRFKDLFTRGGEEPDGDLELWGARAGQLAPAYTDMLMSLKDYYNLGVLTGPDLDLLKSVVPDPTDTHLFTGHGKAVMSGLNTLEQGFKDSIGSRATALEDRYGQYEDELGAYRTIRDITSPYLSTSTEPQTPAIQYYQGSAPAGQSFALTDEQLVDFYSENSDAGFQNDMYTKFINEE